VFEGIGSDTPDKVFRGKCLISAVAAKRSLLFGDSTYHNLQLELAIDIAGIAQEFSSGLLCLEKWQKRDLLKRNGLAFVVSNTWIVLILAFSSLFVRTRLPQATCEGTQTRSARHAP
jgi:hypothetical protein